MLGEVFVKTTIPYYCNKSNEIRLLKLYYATPDKTSNIEIRMRILKGP